MNKLMRKTTGMLAGAIAAGLAGAPALADDTELLLINPTGPAPKPNILFVIDSSGSMSTEESTREIYDSTQTYTGTCDNTMLYWTEIDAVPSCDVANIRRIQKSAYVCASGDKQIAGIGSYTNVMAQFRDGSSGFFSSIVGTDPVRWQQLEPGNSTDMVECRKDRGLHGDGVDATLRFAQKGGDVAPFTALADNEVAWGSWPTSQSITVYDGNYLNYLQNPVTVNQQRVDIVKQVTRVVLNSVENVNVGIMRFNDRDGGPVIQAMTDLDTNRTDVLNTIDTINADGRTPVSETLYEAALYWRGLPAHYGELINEHTTHPDALASSNPEVYRAPAGADVCAKNFNVVLTDGAPVDDFDTPDLAPTLPNWFAALGRGNCTGTNQGDCLDDIAEYLSVEDINPTEPGVQLVTTHTIGFAINLAILEETATASGGEYFLADDVESLTLALLRIVSRITDQSLSFAAPAVAVNTFNRTQNLNDLYLTTFAARGRLHWPGNVKKYRIADGEIVDSNGLSAVNPATGFFNDNAQSFWSATADGNDVEAGGAANRLPAPANRNLYTNITTNTSLSAPSNHLSPANESTFTLADLGLTGSADEPTREQVIRWARGEDLLDEDFDPTTLVRNAMGDPLHSQPAAVVYGGTADNPDAVVFAATNDGYVHAINATTGQEIWSFIPREHLSNLTKLMFDPESKFKHYGVDGDIVPVVADRNRNGIIESADGDFVHIIFGMRRGGRVYYSLDVTNRNSPQLNWRLSAPEFGQSWSAPTIARVDMVDARLNADKAVVVIGGGYDTVHDTLSHPATPDQNGAGLYFVDLQSGQILWRASADSTADLVLPTMTRAIPNQIRVIDLNGDGLADRMYVSDLGGQILRFDIFGGKAPNGIGPDALVTGGVIAQLGAEGNGAVGDPDTRRFYNAPDISIFNDNVQNRRFIAVSIGSGYRAHPLDNTPVERFYSIRDANAFNQLSQFEYDNYQIVRDTDLIEISGTVGTVITKNDAGWKLTLPPDQKVLSGSTTFNNEIFFVAFSPDNAAAASCAAGRGRNFLYRVSVQNGDPILQNGDVVVPGTEDQLRVQDLAQGGIAPSPRFLFPSPDSSCTGDDCTPPPLGCVGVECFDPGFPNNPVRTLWTQDGIE